MKGELSISHSAALSRAFRRNARFNLRHGGKDDVADHLQAPGADRIQRVPGRVPRLVVEIDDLHGGDACLQEWQMIVFDCR